MYLPPNDTPLSCPAPLLPRPCSTRTALKSSTATVRTSAPYLEMLLTTDVTTGVYVCVYVCTYTVHKPIELRIAFFLSSVSRGPTG